VNYARIALASLGAMVAYFVYGFAMFAAWPSMKTEFMKYPNVYRPQAIKNGGFCLVQIR